jgi:hypothetical protein
MCAVVVAVGNAILDFLYLNVDKLPMKTGAFVITAKSTPRERL